MLDNPTIMDIIGIATAITVLLGAGIMIFKVIRPLYRRTKALLDKWESFITDWSGEEARPGRDRVPGVMERLNEIDGQLKNNGGSSVKDAVDRIEIRVNEIDDRLAEGDKKFEQIANEILKIQKDIY